MSEMQLLSGLNVCPPIDGDGPPSEETYTKWPGGPLCRYKENDLVYCNDVLWVRHMGEWRSDYVVHLEPSPAKGADQADAVFRYRVDWPLNIECNYGDLRVDLKDYDGKAPETHITWTSNAETNERQKRTWSLGDESRLQDFIDALKRGLADIERANRALGRG